MIIWRYVVEHSNGAIDLLCEGHETLLECFTCLTTMGVELHEKFERRLIADNAKIIIERIDDGRQNVHPR